MTGLRFDEDQGSFDARDWKKANPLEFTNLADKWLAVKEREVKPKSFANLRNYMSRAKEAWGQTNIKEIQYGELEDFFLEQNDISDKTKANIRSCLNSFWTWLRKRKVLTLAEMPDFPEIGYELGMRKIIDKQTQEAILDEIHKLTYELNPKIWLGMRWLCTYIALRPGDLLSIQEQHIDLENWWLIIPHPTKSKKPKIVPLIEEDIELLKSMPRGFPELYFFRHHKGNGGAKPGQRFGKDYLYKWWKRACENLGIEGVDLYGGTRNSSASALSQYRTPEEMKRATMHQTNKAFERYFVIEGDYLRDIYADTRKRKEKIGKEFWGFSKM